MNNKIRRTGLDAVGDTPWGTHFCQFYKTKQDLLDTLVPYFASGLKVVQENILDIIFSDSL